jgi:hypothetical protein
MAGFVVDGSDSFVSKLAHDGARVSLFEANIDMAGMHDATVSANFAFMCKGIQIPSNAIGVTTVMYKGRAVKIPGNRTYDDLTTTILNDEGYLIRNMVENWMSKLNSHWGNVRSQKHVAKIAGANKYTSSMTLKAFKKTGVVDGEVWKFENCWPTSLDQIDVNWEPNDAIMEYTVNWAYDYWITKAA